MGSGKVKGYARVDFGACRIEKAGKRGNAGLGKGSDQAAGNRIECGAGQAHNTDATAPGRGGHGGNQVSLLSACHFRSGA